MLSCFKDFRDQQRGMLCNETHGIYFRQIYINTPLEDGVRANPDCPRFKITIITVTKPNMWTYDPPMEFHLPPYRNS